VKDFARDICTSIYGNPHSESKPAIRSGELVDETRLRVLHFFNAKPDEYDVIFVQNTTAAVKLVMDSFRDYTSPQKMSKRLDPGKKSLWRRMASRRPKNPTPHTEGYTYLYHKDCHTSIVGMREYSNSHFCFEDDAQVEKWIKEPSREEPTIFAYPGQSNMTGRRLPLDWPRIIQNSPKSEYTYTLLDAAGLSTTKELHVSLWQPDFVAVSFYKIFGFPDLGALLLKKDRGGKILDSRKYFGGGTVDMVTAIDDSFFAKRKGDPHLRHEDGTLPFHNIIALNHALNTMERVYGGIANVGRHTQDLTRECYQALTKLKHSNGQPLCRIYNDPKATYGDPNTQGATISFSLLTSAGTLVNFKTVEKEADDHDIYIRSGSLCNPGGVASLLGWCGYELQRAWREGHTCSNPLADFNGRTTGVVRVSFGAPSSMEDVEKVITFIGNQYIDEGVNQALNEPMRQAALARAEEEEDMPETTGEGPSESMPTDAQLETLTVPITSRVTSTGSCSMTDDSGSEATEDSIQTKDQPIGPPADSMMRDKWMAEVTTREVPDETVRVGH